ncbi:hypothetical protein [Paludibaculum fermentans]|uniref:Uncharacterized protein n=1 Tax=Paludibaculum fermentans TaxID=1473598 RepID=A0A7S7SLD6_PALFE|nr:hypothetical protein [Paludibaculum fermentans]QOY88718.1 hypothetical protein IRI77_01780 [Paludibaculum fermentans]
MRFCLLIMSFAVCAMGAAAQPGPSRPKASNIVLLEFTPGFKDGCGTNKMEFVRSWGDGSAETSAFRVSEGSLLVITDVDWRYVTGPPNQFAVLRLLVQNLGDPAKSRRTFESAVRLDGFGNGGSSERMTTGFVVRPEARICAEVPGEAEGSVVRLSRVLLRGYVTNER